MRLNTDAKALWLSKGIAIEIGGVHDRRRSNPAGFRSRLTFWPLLQQFLTNRDPFVWRDNDVRQPSRFFFASFLGAPTEKRLHSWTPWPQAPVVRRFAFLLSVQR